MPTLRFESCGADAFGEVAYFHEEYDNGGSGEPIEYFVFGPVIKGQPQLGVIVTGQYSKCNGGIFLTIGISNYDPNDEYRDFPPWPMRIEAQNCRDRNGFQPSLVIEAPDGVAIKCISCKYDREEDE
jgi:hypothetical protein